MNLCQKKEKFRKFMKCFIKDIEKKLIGICSERPKKIITRDWSYHFFLSQEVRGRLFYNKI